MGRARRWLNVEKDPAPSAPSEPGRPVEVIQDDLYSARCAVEQLEEPFLRALVGPSITTLGLFFTLVVLVIKPAVDQEGSSVAVWLPLLVTAVVVGGLAVMIIRTAAGRDRDLARAQNQVRYLTLELDRTQEVPVSAGSPAPTTETVRHRFRRR